MKLQIRKVLAEKLNLLQSLENNGREVSCVRDIVFELGRGSIDTARAICNNEWDKIASYPKLQTLSKKPDLLTRTHTLTAVNLE